MLSPGIGPKWHGFPSLPYLGSTTIWGERQKGAPHPHFTDEDIACVRQSVHRLLPSCLTSPTPVLEESKHAKPSHLRSIPLAPRPLSITVMPSLPSPQPLFQGAWKLTSPPEVSLPSPTAPKPGQGIKILHALGQLSPVPQGKIHHGATKIPCAAAKTQHSQISE